MEKAIKRYFPIFALPTFAAFVIGFIIPFIFHFVSLQQLQTPNSLV